MKKLTFGKLKQEFPSRFDRSVKDEIRANLMESIRDGKELFPGIIGFGDTVIPALTNALLSRQNLILLGLRGQAKSRILRSLTRFLDESVPVIGGCEIHCSPYAPICPTCLSRSAREGDALELEWLGREDRFVEKLATPDVTIADMVGDLDPIRAARAGRDLSALENIHFGLLPRAHRGIFAINELPDLAPRIQVGLFNVMQEGDVQIKGFPIRLPVDVFLAFSANPEDYTARGKIVTPLKDRIGAEIKTHYARTLGQGIEITRGEAWTSRSQDLPTLVPDFVWEVVEGIAFLGRTDPHIDSMSGVSQRLPISCVENCISNAERRGLAAGEKSVVRPADVYAALPAVTGKLELEYEGELEGVETIARRLIRKSIGEAFLRRFQRHDFDQVVTWFEMGGQLQVGDMTSSRDYLEMASGIQGLLETVRAEGVDDTGAPEEAVSLIEFLLEGLCSQKRVSRNSEEGYHRKPEEGSDPRLAEITSRKDRSFN